MTDALTKKPGERVTGASAPLAGADVSVALMTPRQQAEAAWHPGSRYSVDELEALLRAQRE